MLLINSEIPVARANRDKNKFRTNQFKMKFPWKN